LASRASKAAAFWSVFDIAVKTQTTCQSTTTIKVEKSKGEETKHNKQKPFPLLPLPTTTNLI